MPPLRHKVGEVFDVEKSEVVAWALSRPEVKQFLFDKMRDSGRIKYDPSTGTWSGVPYVKPSMPEKTVGKAGRPPRFTDDQFLAYLPKNTWMSAAQVGLAVPGPRATVMDYLRRLTAADKIQKVDGKWFVAECPQPAVLVEDVEA